MRFCSKDSIQMWSFHTYRPCTEIALAIGSSYHAADQLLRSVRLKGVVTEELRQGKVSSTRPNELPIRGYASNEDRVKDQVVPAVSTSDPCCPLLTPNEHGMNGMVHGFHGSRQMSVGSNTQRSYSIVVATPSTLHYDTSHETRFQHRNPRWTSLESNKIHEAILKGKDPHQCLKLVPNRSFGLVRQRVHARRALLLDDRLCKAESHCGGDLRVGTTPSA